MVSSTQQFLNQTLSRYVLEERLGSGGMARVYRGQDKTLNRPVAIKVLHEHLSQQGNFRERFEREAQLVAQLNHPNIVQVYDFSVVTRDEDCLYYMVMSYLPGKTLRDALDDYWHDDTMMPVEQVVAVATDIAEALDYAHARGMIHRDIKPANILFDERNQAVLTDFGIARMAQSSTLTQEGNTVGTPAYMSPEQATGDSLDSRSDLYAFGVIVYEMLAGRPPFDDDGSLSVLLKHLNDPVPALTSHGAMTNPDLELVIGKILAKLPEQRYQTARAFVEDLTKALHGLPVDVSAISQTKVISTGPIAAVKAAQDDGATSDAPAQAPARGVFRSPLLLLVAGLILMVTVAIVGVLNNRDGSASAADEDTAGPIAPSMTGPTYFTSTFTTGDDFNEFWEQGTINLVTRTISENGFYRIQSDLSDMAVATLFRDGTDYSNMAMQMLAVLEEGSSAASGYGLVFRYIDNDNYNVFAVDGLGRYSIWVRADGVWRELRDADETWTENPAVNRINDMNLLALEVEGDTFNAFVNGVQVASVTNDTHDAGLVGIYIASPPSGNATIAVDMYQVVDSMLSLADSMTGSDYNVPSESPPEQPEE